MAPKKGPRIPDIPIMATSSELSKSNSEKVVNTPCFAYLYQCVSLRATTSLHRVPSMRLKCRSLEKEEDEMMPQPVKLSGSMLGRVESVR